MPDVVVDSPDPSCSLLLSGSGIQVPQPLGPDPFSPRAREARGRFAKGGSGNPHGRPRGIRNPRRRVPDLVACPLSPPALSNLLDRKPHLLRPLAVQLLRPPLTAIDPAERLGIDLSSLRTVEDFRRLLPTVLAAIAHGKITPGEGARIARRVRGRLRAIQRHARFERWLARGTAPRLDKTARPACNAGATSASALRGDQRSGAVQPSTTLRSAVRAASAPTPVDTVNFLASRNWIWPHS